MYTEAVTPILLAYLHKQTSHVTRHTSELLTIPAGLHALLYSCDGENKTSLLGGGDSLLGRLGKLQSPLRLLCVGTESLPSTRALAGSSWSDGEHRSCWTWQGADLALLVHDLLGLLVLQLGLG